MYVDALLAYGLILYTYGSLLVTYSSKSIGNTHSLAVSEDTALSRLFRFVELILVKRLVYVETLNVKSNPVVVTSNSEGA